MTQVLFFCLQTEQQRLTEDQLAINGTLETSRAFISDAERMVAEVDAMAQVRWWTAKYNV